jgi:site-specific recombinase XerD
VLSREEIVAILKHLTGMDRLIVMLLHGAGLRLEECLELPLKDLDFERQQLTVRQGKGRQDRWSAHDAPQFRDGSAGGRVRHPTVQELLGHRDVRTTMTYLHVMNRGALGVKSPIDRL